MPDNDREVFAYFRRSPEPPAAVSSLAYAAFAFDKFEWMAKVEDRTGSAPTQEEVDRWISDLPDSRLDEILKTALTALKQTYDVYLQDAWKEAYKAGQEDAIVVRVTAATSFWRNLPGNLAVGIASSFAFALLLVLASVVFNRDPSPIALYQKLAAPPAPAPLK